MTVFIMSGASALVDYPHVSPFCRNAPSPPVSWVDSGSLHPWHNIWVSHAAVPGPDWFHCQREQHGCRPTGRGESGRPCQCDRFNFGRLSLSQLMFYIYLLHLIVEIQLWCSWTKRVKLVLKDSTPLKCEQNQGLWCAFIVTSNKRENQKSII